MAPTLPGHSSGDTAQQLSRRRLLLLTGLLPAVAACGSDEGAPPTGSTSPSEKGADDGVDSRPLAMTVYKDESCGCCDGWVEHANDHDFSITVEHPASLQEVWDRHHISQVLRSCHLTLNPDGHVFVGHVPAPFVLEYLADPPKGGRGLSVPAMPVGSPGMEQGERFDPYEVLLLTDGEPRVFAKVTRASQQRSS